MEEYEAVLSNNDVNFLTQVRDKGRCSSKDSLFF